MKAVAIAVAAVLSAASQEPVARVGDQEITAEQLVDRLRATRENNASAEVVVQQIVDDTLLAAEARRQGLADDPEVKELLDAQRRRLAAQRFVQQELEATAKPDEGFLRSIFHSGADSAEVNLLLFTTREQAQAARTRLEQKPDFAAEALGSVHPKQRGDLGTVSRGQLDAAIAEQVFASPVNSLFGPVQLKLGWAVGRTRARRIGTDAEYAKRRDGLEAFARKQIGLQAKEHYLAQLRKSSNARVDEEFIQSTGTRLEFGPGEAERVIATVAGRKVRWREVLVGVQQIARGNKGGHFSGPGVKLSVANQHRDWMLLEEVAVERGHDRTPEVEARMRLVEREALAGAFRRHHASSVPEPTASELETAHAARRAEFTTPGQRTCSHILAKTKDGAEALRREIEKGEPFEALAASFSADGATARRGGLLGEVTDERLQELAKKDAEPAIASAIKETPPNQTSKPVRSRGGWHLFRCGPRAEARVAALSEVQDALLVRLRAEAGEAALRRRIAELRAAAKITVDVAAAKRAAAAVN